MIELVITLLILGGVASIILSGVSGMMQYKGADDFPQFKIFLDKIFKYISNLEMIDQTENSTTLRIYMREFSGNVSEIEVTFEESDGHLTVYESNPKGFDGLKGLNFTVKESGVIVSVGRRDSREFVLFYPFVGR